MENRYSAEYQQAQLEALEAWLKMSPRNHLVRGLKQDRYTGYQCAGYGGMITWGIDKPIHKLVHNSFVALIPEYEQKLHEITVEPENGHFYHKDHSWEADKIASQNSRNRERNLRKRLSRRSARENE